MTCANWFCSLHYLYIQDCFRRIAYYCACAPLQPRSQLHPSPHSTPRHLHPTANENPAEKLPVLGKIPGDLDFTSCSNHSACSRRVRKAVRYAVRGHAVVFDCRDCAGLLRLPTDVQKTLHRSVGEPII